MRKKTIKILIRFPILAVLKLLLYRSYHLSFDISPECNEAKQVEGCITDLKEGPNYLTITIKES